MKANPQNLDFTEGIIGSTPAAWLLGPLQPRVAVYLASIATANQCAGSEHCGKVHSLRRDPSITRALLYQDLDAAPYLGQTLTYRASVRIDPELDGVARLIVRVHRKDCSTAFRNDLGSHPVVSRDWRAYEIRAPIAWDAYHIEFGVQLVGTGTVWIDKVSMDVSPPSQH